MRQITDNVKTFLNEFRLQLRNRGFVRKLDSQAFARPTALGRDIVHIAVISHRTDSDLAMNFAIRVDAVEEIVNALADDAPFPPLSEKEKGKTATIGTQVRDQHGPIRWTVTADASGIGALATQIAKEVDAVGLPYFARFSDPEEIYKILCDGGPAGAGGISITRCERAVAMAYVLGKKDIPRLVDSCVAFLSAREAPEDVEKFQRFAREVAKGQQGVPPGSR
jgi:hypothetical protein